MPVKLKKPINPSEYETLAKSISCMLEGCINEGIPYEVNSPRSNCPWVLDQNNDWRLQFSNTDLSEIKIIHRYQNIQAVLHFENWLAYKYDGEVV